jgi:microcystin-dependent protein
MSDAFVGEIRMLSFGWAPRGWALCDGATMLIQQNAALYSLLGVQFGGDAKVNFKLPDMRGRTPVCSHYASDQGKGGGVESVTLTAAQLSPHTHALQAYSGAGDTATPAVNFYAEVPAPPGGAIYGSPTNMVALDAGSMDPAGGGSGGGATAHNNIQPFQVVNYVIALQGLYPPRT